MRVVHFLAFIALVVIAVVLAALGAFAIWLPFSSDPPDTASGFLIGVGCCFLAVALMLAWVARQAWRFYRE
jgi:multisubunit Na+/H+ antiporter MnhB subunit